MTNDFICAILVFKIEKREGYKMKKVKENSYHATGEKARRDALRKDAEAEMNYELSANFPKGTTMVNIFTGKTFKVK